MAGSDTMQEIKNLRYNVMVALYFPILAYAFSTFDLSEDTFAVSSLDPVIVGPQTVVLGQPFEATAFLAAGTAVGKDNTAGQQLTGAGNLAVIGDSMFRMATGELLAEGEDEKMVDYSGSFRYMQINEEFSTIDFNGQFKVIRPEIVAVSEATQTLYRQSRNSIRINVPGLENRQLKLAAGGQEVNQRSITLSPASDRVDVRVFLVDEEAGDIYLGQKEFFVVDPPRPEIRVLDAGGREISSGESISRRRAVLEFQVVPDREFANTFPQDARYSIGSATISVRKGQLASQEIGTFNLQGGKITLTRQLRGTGAGDQVLVKLQNVVRINHAGQAIAVPLRESTRTLSFTLS